MNPIIKKQLQQLETTHRFKIDGKEANHIPDEFSEIIFEKDTVSVKDTIIVTFEDYFLRPYKGFDFHQKWNNDIAPFAKKMYGNIVKETEKMYLLNVHTETSTDIWQGWCPKKSCKIVNIKQGDN